MVVKLPLKAEKIEQFTKQQISVNFYMQTGIM